MKKLLLITGCLAYGLLNSIAATFTVTTTADAGAGSFRQAILDANAAAGADIIDFNIGGGGAQTITLSTTVTVTTEIFIDGSSQPGFTTTPLISIAGTSMFRMTSANGATVQWLDFSGNAGSRAIWVTSIQNCTIENNNLSGSYVGMRLDGSNSNNTINNNDFSGSVSHGLYFVGGNNQGNIITNNTINNAAGYAIYYNYGLPASIEGNDFTASANAIYLNTNFNAAGFRLDPTGTASGVNMNTYADHTNSIFNFQNCSKLKLESWDFPSLFSAATDITTRRPVYCDRVNDSYFNNNNMRNFYNAMYWTNSNYNDTIINNDMGSATNHGLYFVNNNNYSNIINNNLIDSTGSYAIFYNYGLPASIEGNDFTASASAIYLNTNFNAAGFRLDPTGTAGGVNMNTYGEHTSSVFNFQNCRFLKIENWDFPSLFSAATDITTRRPVYCDRVNDSYFNNNNMRNFYNAMYWTNSNYNDTIINNDMGSATNHGLYFVNNNNYSNIINNNLIDSTGSYAIFYNYGLPASIEGNDFTASASAIYLNTNFNAAGFRLDPTGTAGGVNMNTYGEHTSSVFNFQNCRFLKIENWDFPSLFSASTDITTRRPVYCDRVNDSYFSNNNMRNFYNAMYWTNSNYNDTIINNDMGSATNHGLYFVNNNNYSNIIENNLIDSSGSYAIFYNYGLPASIEGNDFTASAGAIYLNTNFNAAGFRLDPTGTASGVNMNTYGEHTSTVFNFQNCRKLKIENWDFPSLFAATANITNLRPVYCDRVNDSYFSNNNMRNFYNAMYWTNSNNNDTIINNDMGSATNHGLYFVNNNNSNNVIQNNLIDSTGSYAIWYNYGLPASIEGNNFTASAAAIYMNTNFNATGIRFDPTGTASGVNMNTYGEHTSTVFNFQNCRKLKIENWDFPSLFAATANITNLRPMYCDRVNDSYFSNNNMRNFYNAMYWTNSNNNDTIINNDMGSATNHGLYFVNNNNSNNVIQNNSVDSCGSYGIYYYYGTPNEVSGNDFTGSANGFFLRQATGFKLDSNNFVGQTGTSIHMEYCSTDTIIDAITSGTGGTGIYIFQSNNMVVDNNESCGRTYGVRINGTSANNRIENCSIANATSAAIRLDNGSQSNTLIDANTFYGNAVDVQDNGTSTTITNSTTASSANWCVNLPPTAICHDTTILGCNVDILASLLNNGSSDPEGDSLMFSLNPAGPYTAGVHNVFLIVDDGNGNVDSCATTITIDSIIDQAVTATLDTVTCAGDSTTINVASSQVGVNYYLFNDGDSTLLDGPVAGDGNALLLSTHAVASSSTYKVKGQTYSGGFETSGPSLPDLVQTSTGSPLDGLSAFTIEMWIKRDAGGGGIQPVWHSGNGAYMFFYNDGQVLLYNGGGDGTRLQATVPGTLPVDGTWHHIAFTQTGPGAGAIYVDGNSITPTQNDFTGFSAGLGNLRITTNSYLMNGNIDDYRIWSIAKTQSEIQSSMNTCLTGSEANLELLYDFESGSGTDIYDKTSNGYNASFAGVNSGWGQGSTVCGCSLEMTQTATVSIETPGSYTSNPTDVNTCTGTDVTFTNVSSGNIDSQVWQVSTDAGSTWSDITLGSGIYSGTTASILLTGVTTAEDGYMYRSIATKCGNYIDSTTGATLTILSPVSDSQNVTSCDSADVNGTMYFSTQTVIDTLTSAASNGCDSIITTNLTINNAVSDTQTITGCDSVDVNGTMYYTTQTVTDVFTSGAANGCDSTIVTNLTINNAITTNENRTSCGSAVINGNTYTASQVVTDVFASGAINGCDSTHITNLTISNFSLANITITGCDSATVFGNTYFSNTTVNDTIIGGSAQGCDTITIATVNVNNSVVTNETRTSCGAITINGNTYSSSQVVTDVFVGGSANGCDSTHITDLTISTFALANVTLSGCDSITIFGNTFTADTVVNDTIIGGSAQGCDTITSATITINASSIMNQAITSCDSMMINGTIYFTSQTINDTLMGINCDSIIITDLTINLSKTTSVDTTIEQGTSITVGTNTYDVDGTYVDTLATSNNCDSVVTTNLTVTVGGINTLISGNVNIFPNPTNGIVTVNSTDGLIKTIRIVDIQGKEQAMILNVNSINKQVDISNLADGVYFMKLTLENGSQSITRVTKMK